ncbi:g11105 [Coccomyxa viridis]|uniref:G11105 protein n=1 Tax=Coccomyxa viridis TaxID=1274662 RepID=A0ABP1GBA3_9CHLO
MARYEVLEQLPLEQLVCLALSSSSCVEQSSQISQNQGAYRKDQKKQKRRLCWTRAAHTLQDEIASQEQALKLMSDHSERNTNVTQRHPRLQQCCRG